LLTLPEARRKNAGARADAINSCDIAILCLPDQAAREAVAAIVDPAVRVIDASSAHRTDRQWVYGFPEMTVGQSERIATAHRVSNPGCYPTGAIALLRPLVEAALLPADYPVTVYAVSGYSGGGRASVEQYEGVGASGGLPFQVYGLGLEHKHTPEIEQRAGLTSRPIFVPAYGAFRQGIVLTIPLHLRLMGQADGRRLHDCLAGYYADSAGISVLPQADAGAALWLDPQALNGTNDMQMGVFHNERHGQALLTVVFDNLGKGASGAAVQNLDLMLQAR